MAADVLTTTDAAKMLGISVRTAQLMIESGKLPSWKTPGGHRRVLRSDVEAILPDGPVQQGLRSARVLVVTSAERREVLAARLDAMAHIAFEFRTDTWSAATAMGGRVPAAVVVDIVALKDDAVGLLQALAEDGRLAEAELIALTASGKASKAGEAKLPSRVRKSSLEQLSGWLKPLSEDARPPEALSHAGFPIAPNEASRLQAVKRSRLVDTPPESAFDRITWLAANDLKMPVALMTLLTGERQWFKSRQGLAMPDTPRSWAFCNHTLLQRDVFEVKDLSKHPSFADNPAVASAPHFRFYAGSPIHDADGFPLGSICVIDYRPRQLDARQRQTLKELAAIASDAVLLRQLQAAPTDRMATRTHELRSARN
ncbi:helix-turn-helix domain-containing protein [Roseateles amylovorans]|uniref:Helix-turn-helix domain-containing protein n=1 Tax=Roseateles amylovorans TaxID=2978473 RepID=A0ABY6ASD1_9BURK|nr:helix-turn-helix domain-containing protein [Roseateles amylovorans]UXH76139.1 helix-turn-helix domain-containing protein [Roseateles amylovorans]